MNLRCRLGESFDSVGSPVDVDMCVTLLRGLFKRANHSVMTAGVAHASSHDLLRDIVDCHVIVPDDTGSEEIDAADWAGAIVETVQELRRRREDRARRSSNLPACELH
jgi:hypothetical protein